MYFLSFTICAAHCFKHLCYVDWQPHCISTAFSTHSHHDNEKKVHRSSFYPTFFFHDVVVVVAALYSFGWIVFNYNSRSSLLKKMMHNEKIAPIYPSFKFNYWRILRISPFTFGLDDIFQLVLPQIIFLALFLTNWKKKSESPRSNMANKRVWERDT